VLSKSDNILSYCTNDFDESAMKTAAMAIAAAILVFAGRCGGNNGKKSIILHVF
jgi:hypothetical protein